MDDLLCKEKETVLEVEVRNEEYQLNQSHQEFDVSEEEHVGVMIEREIVLGFKKDENLVFDDWLKRARLNAINWILKVCSSTYFLFYHSNSVSLIKLQFGKKKKNLVFDS